MAITYSVTTDTAARLDVDVVVLPISTTKELSSHVPAGVAEELKVLARKRDFTAEWASTCVAIAPRGMAAQFVALVGLGSEGDSSSHAEALRRGIASVVAEAQRHVVPEIGVFLAGHPALVEATVEGIGMTTYTFAEHSEKLKKQSKHQIKRVFLAVRDDEAPNAKRALKKARQTLQGMELTRDLVNQPANHIVPADLVATARELAASSDDMSVRILDHKAAEKEGFTAFLAVAKGSVEDPYVIHLTYTPETKNDETPKLCLVGKGITFDSGGLSLKPSDFMEEEKRDMAGAATVLGAFNVLAQRGAAIEVHGIIATCENMPSGSAYRPGDVIVAKNGKTIEVLNTDAEGRVTLADALSYAVEQEPDAIIDLATLTGAAAVAFGENMTGLWGTDQELAENVKSASRQAGENIAELPMPHEYRPLIESKVGDVRNHSATRYGGAITAAMFLREFVDDTPWVHLDIAGPAYASSQIVPYWTFGGTGWGVRTLLNVIDSYDTDR